MRIIPIIVLLAMAGALTLADSGVPGISAEALESLRDSLAEYGQMWLDTGEEDGTVGILLDSVWYTEESPLMLRVAFSAEYEDDTVDLYVTEALLSPLEYAEVDVIVAALPVVATQIERIGQYQTALPTWTDQERSLMTLAQSPVEEVESAAQQRQRERGQALLDARSLAMRTTQLHNEKVHDLRMLQVRLWLLADTAAADEAVLTRLGEAQSDASLDYFDILTAIRFEAEYMGQERAEVYYEGLKGLWEVGNMAARSYVDYEQVEMTEAGGLVFSERSAKPGQSLLRTLNHLASYARQPALQIR
jgi:hypothetical protein